MTDLTAGTIPFTRSASISSCGTYRWTLKRAWAEGPSVCYIGHNPSTASHEVDDMTSQAWVHHARFNGFGSYTAVNLLPFRAADVRACHHWAQWDKNGPDWSARDAIMQNEGVVAREIRRADRVVACWGALDRDGWGSRLMESVGETLRGLPDVYCLGVTNAGAPKHAMARGKHRIPRDQRFVLWRAGERAAAA